MILDFLAVCTVADFVSVKTVNGDHRRDGQRNSLVRRSEQHVKIRAVLVVNGARIKFPKTAELTAALI